MQAKDEAEDRNACTILKLRFERVSGMRNGEAEYIVKSIL